MRGQNTQAADRHPNYIYMVINRNIALTVSAEDEAQDPELAWQMLNPTPFPTHPQGLFMK